MNAKRTGAQRGRLALAGWLARAALLCAIAGAPAQAQLRLDITQGVRDAVPIAVVPFGGQAEGGPGDVAAVIASDLQLSGRFQPLERRDMVSRPHRGAEVRFEDWRLLKSDFLVVGRVEPDAAGLAVTFELFNVQSGQALLSEKLVTSERGLRATAHRIADQVFERLTGIPGAFSTRIAYVSAEGRAPAQALSAGRRRRGRLRSAHGDANRPSRSCRRPGRRTARASRTSRSRARPRPSTCSDSPPASGAASRHGTGINGAPAWSPDGRKLALTLSRDGNLDIYMLELATQALTRITSDDAIDTEPEWSRDGSSLYFTSDRAGSAQVYRVAAGGGAGSPAAHVHQRLQRAAARVAGRPGAGAGDARPRRLSHRHARPQDAQPAGADRRPAGRVAELCAERRRRASTRPAPAPAARSRWCPRTGASSSG